MWALFSFKETGAAIERVIMIAMNKFGKVQFIVHF